MAWSRFDDGYDTNPKMLRVGLTATGLHARAVTYSRRELTDGFVPDEFVNMHLAVDPLLKPRERKHVLELLVARGAFVEVEDGFCVHDYADYNPTRADVEAHRDSDRKRKGTDADSSRNPNGRRASSERNESGLRADSERPSRARTTQAQAQVRKDTKDGASPKDRVPRSAVGRAEALRQTIEEKAA